MPSPHPSPIRSFQWLPSLRTFILAALVVTAAAPSLRAEPFKAEDGFGIGFILGKPTGLSGSLPIGHNNAINAALGYSLIGETNLHAQADYVWFIRDLLPVESGKIAVYYGPGAYMIAAKDAAIGIRMVGGVEYRFEAAPFQVFLEIGPGINILPDTEAYGGGGLGLRYFF